MPGPVATGNRTGNATAGAVMITRLMACVVMLTGCASQPPTAVNLTHQAWQQLQSVRHTQPTQSVVHAPDVRVVTPQGREQFRVRP